MPNRPSNAQSRLFAQLLREYEPRIRRGFYASVTDLQANVDWRALLAALEAGNTDAAIAALNISPAAWAAYSAEVTAAYAAAGSAVAAQIRQAGIGSIGTRFNMANPRAEEWIRRNVGGSIVGFTEEAVKTAREVILEGYAAGQGPRNIATSLAGRANGAGGARTGGIVGLDAPRAHRFHKVSTGMQTPEGVQSLVIEHRSGALSLRYKVNRATANRILSAYRAGTEVPEDQRILSETQYKNALLKERADTIAITETGDAVLAARDEEWRQVLEQEGLRPDQIVKTWRHGRGPSAHHRPDHYAMAGTEVVGIDTPFVMGDGTAMLFAHDPAGGAKHNINCGCSTDYRVLREVD